MESFVSRRKTRHRFVRFWRQSVNRVFTDPENPNRLIAELVIPPETGGFWVREIGVFDDTGTMIAVGNTAESYKAHQRGRFRAGADIPCSNHRHLRRRGGTGHGHNNNSADHGLH